MWDGWIENALAFFFARQTRGISEAFLIHLIQFWIHPVQLHSEKAWIYALAFKHSFAIPMLHSAVFRFTFLGRRLRPVRPTQMILVIVNLKALIITSRKSAFVEAHEKRIRCAWWWHRRIRWISCLRSNRSCLRWDNWWSIKMNHRELIRKVLWELHGK